MRRLSLDYLRPANPLPRFGVALLALALFWTGSLIFSYRQAVDEIESYTPAVAEAADAQHKMVPQPTLTPAQAQRLKQDIQHANQLIAQLTTPWEELFRAVESAQSGDIGLLDIQPDASKKNLSISGEARNFTALSAYLRRIQAQKSFTNVYLLNHEIVAEDPHHPLHFELKADWVAP